VSAIAADQLQRLARFYDGVAQSAERKAGVSGFLHVGFYERPDESEASAQLGLVLAAASHVALEPDEQVLDVGCGLGMPAIVLAERFGVRVTALTISPGQAAFAKRLAEQRRQRVRLVVADAHRLPTASGSFGAAFALESLLHMDRKRALAEMRRSLRNRGDIVLCDWVLTEQVSEAEKIELQRSFLMNGVSLETYLQLLTEAGFVGLEYEDWSSQIAPTYDRWEVNVPIFKTVVPILRQKTGYFCIWGKAG